MRLMTLGLCFVIACGGKAASTNTTTTTTGTTTTQPAAVEFGEMTLWEGDEAAMKIHADGSTELGFRSGRLEMKNGHASSDQLPLQLKPGPTIRADGTIVFANEPRVRINADGTITDLRDNTAFPIAVTPDKLTITNAGHELGFELAATGAITVFGGNNPPKRPLRIEGADTPGKRRTMLAFISLQFLGKDEAPTTKVEAVATARPAVVTDEMVAIVDKMHAALESLVTQLEAAKGDCKKATAAVKAETASANKLKADAERMEAAVEADPAGKQWFRDTYAPKMLPVIERIVAATEGCKTDKAFAAALKDHPLLPRAKPKK